MRIRNRLLAAVVLLASAAAGSAAAAEASKCSLSKAADLPITMRGMRPLVTAKVNGQDTLFLVDSGAFYSTMSSAAAARLNLPLQPAPQGMYISGVGGAVRVSQANVAELKIDQIPVKNAVFLVTEGPGQFDAGTAGLLGQNLLGIFDMEYDLANGVIRLIIAKGCTDIEPVYWRSPTLDVSEVVLDPLAKAGDRGRFGNVHMRGSATINGRPIRVMFDTGASTSVLSLSTAKKLGFNPDAPGVKAIGLSGGIGNKVSETWIAPFESFEVGGETIKNAKLRVSDVLLGNDDMLIGADFFLSHRMYLSRKQNRLFFTYNGGPVFHLDREPATSSEQVQAKAPPAGATGAGDPTDVGGLTRRGLASLSRRDYARAIADLDRAVTLDPKLAETYFHRATAHMQAGHRALAQADLDQAVKLKPDYTQALMARADLYLDRKDLARASADFDAALKSPGADSETHLNVGAQYADAGYYQAALAQYDAWIAAHPKDRRLAEALNGRCWTRALSGKELDKALADCDAALKPEPRNPSVLDSRGLVKLRLGQLDGAIADYDAALKMQPKIAWSLYGRGLAKSRKGLAGDADIAAAVALQPNIRKRGEEIGLEPAKPSSAPAQP